MARNSRRSRGMKKLEPAVQTMSFILSAGSSSRQTIDLSQCASLMNRRFYRQGLNWMVAGFRVITPAGVTGSMSILKLPNTWIMGNSWEKAFRAWQKMNDEALEESPSVKPRFLDFKVYANDRHHTDGYGLNLLPIDGNGIAYVPGEWESSKFEIPTGSAGAQGATASRELLAVGPNYPGLGASGLDAVSLVAGYAASRGLPNVLDPNAPDRAEDVDGFNPDNWIAATFNEGTTQTEGVIEDMISENNIAPYPFENDGVHTDTMYPGGTTQASGLQYHDSGYATPTTIGGITRLRGTNFPCGLIQIAHDFTTPGEGDAVLLQVDLIPGFHRGYLATPMTEM